MKACQLLEVQPRALEDANANKNLPVLFRSKSTTPNHIYN